jgi:predicted small lipoprotein YifL
MRAFILLLAFMCAGLSASCGKTGDLYLPDENESVGTAQDKGLSSETGSTTGS